VSVHVLEMFCPPRSLNMKFGILRRDEKFCCLENEVQNFVCLYPIKYVVEQPIYHSCASLCSLCEGEEGTKTGFIYL
jgi:hypothetical protein